MVSKVTLYVQPGGKNTLLIKRDEFLRDGTIEETHFSGYCIPSLAKHITLTLKAVDTVKSWTADREPDPEKTELVGSGDSLELSLKFAKYKGIDKFNPKNLYAILKIKGRQNKISEFMDNLMKRINYSPWQMDDWNEFTSKTGVPKEEVIEPWRKFTAKEEAPEIHEKKAGRSGKAEQATESPEELKKALVERLAEGEISEETYNKAMERLKGRMRKEESEEESEEEKEEELTPLMKEYGEETGKHAIWKGKVTKQFEKWKEKKSRNMCPECGAELEPDAEFCIKCGYKLKGGEK